MLEDAEDAREALDLIVKRADFSEEMSRARLDDIKVTALRELRSEHISAFCGGGSENKK